MTQPQIKGHFVVWVRPICKCHGKPMHKHNKGTWQCAVKNAEAHARWRQKNLEYERLRKMAWRASSEKHRETNRIGQARYRARKRGAVVGDRWTRDDLIARDGSLCHLCGEPIDLSLKHPHTKSFTEDHVIPLARGGAHTFTNIKPAHLYCNSSKRDRMQEEVCSS